MQGRGQGRSAWQDEGPDGRGLRLQPVDVGFQGRDVSLADAAGGARCGQVRPKVEQAMLDSLQQRVEQRFSRHQRTGPADRRIGLVEVAESLDPGRRLADPPGGRQTRVAAVACAGVETHPVRPNDRRAGST